MEQRMTDNGTNTCTTYKTLVVKFNSPIAVIDEIFNDVGFWGVNNLKEWIDDYESTRFTAIDEQTAVITSEYNMECVREWLEHHATFAVIAEY